MLKVFCFHSIRSSMALPASSAWADINVHHLYKHTILVEPSWFHCFITNAIRAWGVENFVVTFDDAYADCLEPAMFSASQGVETIIFAPTAHLGQFIHGVPLRVMGVHELILAMRSGVQIGSHGSKHVDWRRLSEEEVSGELWLSTNALRQLRISANKSTDGAYLLAAPYGSFDLNHIELAESLGFTGFYGTLDNRGSNKVITRCLANMDGYIEDKEGGLRLWPWEE